MKPCPFDAAVGGPPQSARCGKPTVATCKVRDQPNQLTRVCEDHLLCYMPLPLRPHPYIIWFERDVYAVIENHDSGDEG